jgi:hypothetical protein
MYQYLSQPPSTRSSQRASSSYASSSRSKAPLEAPVYHAAGSRRLEKARQQSPPSSPSSREVTTLTLARSTRVREHPNDCRLNVGISFDINWDNITSGGAKLHPDWLGYRVKHKLMVLGRRKASFVWKYGANLMYVTETSARKQYWLCRACHESGVRDAAKLVDGNSHIARHLSSSHRINPDVGVLPDRS